MALPNQNQDDEIISEINMTPLIDIMLVLLIIFMVTSSVSLESGLNVELPEVQKAGKLANDTPPVIVTIKEDGDILVQGKHISVQNLEQEMHTALKAANTRAVVLEGDRRSTLGMTIHVMDLAKSAGAKEFALATNEIKKSP